MQQPPATLGDALTEAARRHGGRTAYIDAGREWSFAQMDAQTDRIAAGLLAMGLARGDRIGLLALNQIEWLQLFFAAAKIGVGVIGLSVRYRDSELELMLGDGGAKALFTLGTVDGVDFVAMARGLAPKLPQLRHVVRIDDPAGLPASDDTATLAAARAQVVPHELAMVIYTSGTTGRPKGAALSHRSMLASAGAQAAHTRLGPDDRIQVALPFNHVGGICCGILSFLLGGGCCELVPVFKAETVLAMMRANPPTLLTGVPTMLTLLLMHREKVQPDLSRVRLVITGGSNADATLLAALQQAVPAATVMNLYGLSESSGAIVMTPWGCGSEDLMASIGQPLAGMRLRVAGGDGRELPAGEVGELQFHGPAIVAGYIGQASSEAFDAEGWLRTGDLGAVDARGFITLKGRLKDMFIQGGFNVYPAEVEGVIARHPKVLMAAGIGVPDPVLGEVGRYYIVPRPGSGLTEEEVRTHCAQHLGDYKVPRQVVLREQLPLTPAGKIHKAALRAEGLGAG